VSPPVTPCAPGAAVAFVGERFGHDLADALVHRPARLGTSRARRITELRRCGQLRHAERYGWLSLAGWLLDMKVSEVTALHPMSEALNVRAHAGDVLPPLLGEDPPPVLTTVADTGIEVSDPRDPFGFGVFELLAVALRDGMAAVEGRTLGGGTVADSLRARLEEVARG
jgi:hypothetical protein